MMESILPSSGAALGGSSSLKKSLRELSHASSSLGTAPTSATGPSGITASGLGSQQQQTGGLGGVLSSSSGISNTNPLLTQRGIDSETIQRHVKELEFHHPRRPAPSSASSQKKQRTTDKDIPIVTPYTTSLTQYLNYRRDAQMESILQSERQNMKRLTEEKIQSRLMEDWKVMKRKLVGSVIGGRRLGGVNSSNMETGSSRIASSSLGDSRAQVYVDAEGNMPQLAKLHLQVLTEQYERNHTLVQFDALTQLIQQQQQQQGGAMLSGYQNSTRLLEFMMANNSSSFSSDQSSVVKEQTKGALHFLADSFKTFLVSRVKNGGGVRDGMKGGLIGYIWVFVEMELGREVVNWGGMNVVWRCLYYCLRCGDASAAIEAVQTCKQMSPIVLQILQTLQQTQQQHNTNLFHSSVNTEYRIHPSQLQSITDLYNRAATTAANSPNAVETDAYELACLAMLSQTDPSSTTWSEQVATTIEDYIYMSLWNATYSSNNNNNNNNNADEMNESSCVNQIIRLGESIKEWGPSYFDETGSNPWAYTMPLLLCQQFRSGLVHMANFGGDGLCMALHLALAMWSTRRVADDLIMNGRGEKKRKEEDLLTALIIAYASSLKGVSPEAALAYLVHIPDDNDSPSGRSWSSSVRKKDGQALSKNACAQICRLLLDTKEYQALAGNKYPDGSRNSAGSALDQHLTLEGVSEILGIAADESMRQGNLSDAAELLSLAGRYSSLLSLFNRELASLLIVTEEDGVGKEKRERREFWRNAAIRFHNEYLSQGQTLVLRVLEKERSLSLGNSFQLLLNLMEFFDRCHAQNWESAWELIKNLNLFPSTESEVTQKIELFNSLSTEIQQIFHHVITKSMESLYQQHTALKANIGREQMSPSLSVIHQRLNEIQMRGRLLVTYAGLIPFLNFTDEAKARIAQMEAFMV